MMITSFVWILASTTQLCRSPAQCGDADGLCGSLETSHRLRKGGSATICVGFYGSGTVREGGKALFQVKVDHYSTLSVDARMPPPAAASRPTFLSRHQLLAVCVLQCARSWAAATGNARSRTSTCGWA